MWVGLVRGKRFGLGKTDLYTVRCWFSEDGTPLCTVLHLGGKVR